MTVASSSPDQVNEAAVGTTGPEPAPLGPEAGSAAAALWQPDGPAVGLPTVAQARLWALQAAHPDSTLFHHAFAVRMRGRLRLRLLERCLIRLVQRHDALRTTFMDVAGTLRSIVHPEVALTIPISRSDLTPLAGSDRSLFDLQVREETRRRFDLERAPLLRGRLFALGPDDHILLMTMHRLIGDDCAGAILLDELEHLYQAATARRPAALPELPVRGADLAAWEDRWLDGEGGASDLAYWTRQLAGLNPLRLPEARPRPAVRSTRCDRVQRLVPAVTHDRLRNIAGQDRTAVEAALLAGMMLLLAAETDCDDVAVSTAISGRSQRGTERLVANLANTLVLRVDAGGDPTFREFVHRVRARVEVAATHQRVPFARVQSTVAPGSELSLSPMCPVSFAATWAPPAAQRGQDVELRFSRLLVPVEEMHAELAVSVAEQDDGLLVSIAFAVDLFTADMISALLDRYLTVLAHAAHTPDRRCSALIEAASGAAIATAPSTTPAAAAADSRRTMTVTSPRAELVPLLRGEDRTPVVVVPGGSGSAGMLAGLAGQVRSLALGRPLDAFLATEPLAVDDGHAWVVTTAADYVRELCARQPAGPYLLLGSCVGGVLAMAMAQHMDQTGIGTPHLVLIDTRHPAQGLMPPRHVWRDLTPPPQAARRRALYVGQPETEYVPRDEHADPVQEPERYFERVLYGPRYLRLKDYRPDPYRGEVTLLANQDWQERYGADLGWGTAVERLHIHTLPGDHEGHMADNLELISAILRPLLAGIEAAG